MYNVVKIQFIWLTVRKILTLGSSSRNFIIPNRLRKTFVDLLRLDFIRSLAKVYDRGDTKGPSSYKRWTRPFGRFRRPSVIPDVLVTNYGGVLQCHIKMIFISSKRTLGAFSFIIIRKCKTLLSIYMRRWTLQCDKFDPSDNFCTVMFTTNFCFFLTSKAFL